MPKQLLAPILLLALLAAPAGAQLYDRNNDLEFLTRFVRTYYETDLGMSQEDASDFQRALGHLREKRPEKALEILLELQKKYPELQAVGLLLSETYLTQNENQKALLLLEDMRKQIDTKDHAQHPLLLQVMMLEVQAYRQQKESAHALQLLNSLELDMGKINSAEQEHYFVTLAELELENDQAEAAYQHLKQALTSNARPNLAMKKIKAWSPALAERHYRLGLEAYRESQYNRSLKLALTAYKLNPNEVKYSQLVANAQDHIFEQVNAHFDMALPVLTNSIRNMRLALEEENYGELNREYKRLRDNSDVRFFLNPDYEGYLPVKMQEVLRDVEYQLKARGFDI